MNSDKVGVLSIAAFLGVCRVTAQAPLGGAALIGTVRAELRAVVDDAKVILTEKSKGLVRESLFPIRAVPSCSRRWATGPMRSARRKWVSSTYQMDRQPGHLHRPLAFLNPLLRHPLLSVESHHGPAVGLQGSR